MRAVLGSVWLRLLVTLALLAIVAASIDWAAFARRLAEASPAWIGLAFAMGAAALVIGALRWWWLLSEAGVRLSGVELGRVYAMSTFSGTFLPTAVGGDVARALFVTREPALLMRVSLTILVDRGAAFAGMLAVAWGALLVDRVAIPSGSRIVLAVVTAAVVGGVVVGLLIATRDSLGVRRWLPVRLRALATLVRDVIGVYGRRPATVAIALVSSVAFQLLAAGQLCIIALALGIDLSLPVAATVLTLVTVATLLPVSIAGFGVREGSYVVLLAPFGLDATDATAISLTATVLLVLASLPGAVLLVRHGTRPVLG